MEYVSSGYPDNLLLHWDHTGFLWYACWFALISYYHSRGYFYCDTTKNLRNISFWGFPRGADRIWTGESGCCRPTPYHLATAPYFVVSPKTNDSNGNRTRVTAVKGRCLNRLTMEPKKKKTPRVGLEPTTTRLTAECSTIELSRIINWKYILSKLHTDLTAFLIKPSTY